MAEAAGLPLGVPLVINVTQASSVLTLVPITLVGVGAVEWGVTELLVLSDKIDTETVAFSIMDLDRSISWLSVIGVGAVIFMAREAAGVRRRRSMSGPSALR